MSRVTRFWRWHAAHRQQSEDARETCHNCRFGGVYECRRHAPTGSTEGRAGPVFPSVYNDGCGTWCGDYERKRQ